ncbi:MAG: DUF2510 domain-containing protein [Salinibacterium sp.]|nr:DUF2510 domain-containing protein [Salinibacterium sp.]
MNDEKFGVPAGWYPDPLGLPQLRWWDAQAWTEHTSEARAPIVVQPAARVAVREEALPSRRDLRERERRESGEPNVGASEIPGQHRMSQDLIDAELDTDVEQGELSAQPLLAMTLRELEPPLEDTVDQETPGPRRATSHTNAAPAASALSPLAEELAPLRVVKTMQTYSSASWVIALMPAIQLAVLALIVLTGLGGNLPLVLAVVFAPYLLVIGFAAYDKLLLQVWGHEKPARARWALLTAPGYLVARAVSTVKQTGRGFAPIAVFGSAATAVLAGVLILPGLLISVFPASFADEVERSVSADAAALGTTLTVSCPAPPLRIGDTVTCIATKPSGATDSIVVSLERQNGWIAWKVQDWGNWVLTAP